MWGATLRFQPICSGLSGAWPLGVVHAGLAFPGRIGHSLGHLPLPLHPASDEIAGDDRGGVRTEDGLPSRSPRLVAGPVGAHSADRGALPRTDWALAVSRAG